MRYTPIESDAIIQAVSGSLLSEIWLKTGIEMTRLTWLLRELKAQGVIESYTDEDGATRWRKKQNAQPAGRA